MIPDSGGFRNQLILPLNLNYCILTCPFPESPADSGNEIGPEQNPKPECTSKHSAIPHMVYGMVQAWVAQYVTPLKLR